MPGGEGDDEEASGPHGGSEPAPGILHGTTSHPTRECVPTGGRPEAESEEGPERDPEWEAVRTGNWMGPPQGGRAPSDEALAGERPRLGVVASAPPVGGGVGDWED